MSIAILTPTRERPTGLLDMLGAIMSTTERSVTVYVGIDDDDRSYDDLFIDTPIYKRVDGPQQQLTGWINDLAKIALEDGHTILGSFGDDHRPRTYGWDRQVAEAFDRVGSGLVYCADGLQDERLPTAPFWSADVVRALGWMFPPMLAHMCNDDLHLRLANDLGRRSYLPDVLIEHMHPSAGKAEMDAVYLQNDTHIDVDREAFALFVASAEYRDCIERVRAIL